MLQQSYLQSFPFWRLSKGYSNYYRLK